MNKIEQFYTVTEQDQQAAHELIQKLNEKCKEKGKTRKSASIRRSDYIHQPSGLAVSSWKMNDWDYKKWEVLTPARGLFTRQTDAHRYEIVIRGYDKFFNIDEVGKTKWTSILENTKGPYEVTAKENGCIIFIGGLPNDQIIVTSKHSMGELQNVVAHALKGEEWLDMHIEQVGKNKRDLARFLYINKLTAVAELCDDSFEEHVLPYTFERRGLYLHGLNYNTIDLKTCPSEYVNEFAKEWGFIPIIYYIKNSPDEVKEFTDRVKQDGSLDGRPIEGFVVRTSLKSTGQDFFFKIKYDEPYLMYREWREITKALISKKQPRYKYNTSKLYIDWVKEKIRTEPGLFKGYQQNHGIIHVRDLFLEHLNKEGKSQEDIPEKNESFRKTLLVPIATIGCGKTTIAHALASLFNFGHVQNDNITARNTRLEFHNSIIREFENNDVVCADRNNHIRILRSTLMEAVSKSYPNIRVIALYWNHNISHDEILKITSQRIELRGDNHQSLTPENPNYEGVIRSFLNDFEPLDINNDENFDHVIDLDIQKDVRTNLLHVIEELHSILNIEMPDNSNIDAAIESAINYKPTIRKLVGHKGSNQKKASKSNLPPRPRKPLYYGISLEYDFNKFLKQYFEEHSNIDPRTFIKLSQKNRIPNEHHVTLVFGAKNKVLWEEYEGMCDQQVQVFFDKLVFDSHVMTLVVKKFEPMYVKSTNKVPHVTIGTVDSSVKPREANDMLEHVFDDTSQGKNRQKREDIKVISLDSDLIISGIIKAYYN
ncbi:9679_t:CDS:2 [Scutellospora calospora]|uniref:9679_t:CDS:1 n=1 Tax=Scutellospora calospora TaxID=85575 RepID=A0ACA9JVR6_9GLOM|nr:9679_t:CDS:2 [Scutellospora calospora]